MICAAIGFTGKERDAETGLDFFDARYFSGAQGRFTSPDWSPIPQAVPHVDFGDPQTLNLYGCVRNNPLRYTDSTGHWQLDAAVDQLLTTPTGQEVANFVSRNWDKAAAVGTVALAAFSDALQKNPYTAATPGVSMDLATRDSLGVFKNGQTQQGQQTQPQQGQQSTPASPQGSNYQPNSGKHGQEQQGDDRRGISADAQAGGSLQAGAAQVKPGNSVAVDSTTGKFVVYRTDANGQTHGYQTSWAACEMNSAQPCRRLAW